MNMLSTNTFISLFTENSGTLKILLSFAMGALLGDVFLHLLPEAFEGELQTRGIILFIIFYFWYFLLHNYLDI